MSSVSHQPAGGEHNLQGDAYKLHLKAIISLRASQPHQPGSPAARSFVRTVGGPGCITAALMSVQWRVASRLNRVYFHFFAVCKSTVYFLLLGLAGFKFKHSISKVYDMLLFIYVFSLSIFISIFRFDGLYTYADL